MRMSDTSDTSGSRPRAASRWAVARRRVVVGTVAVALLLTLGGAQAVASPDRGTNQAWHGAGRWWAKAEQRSLGPWKWKGHQERSQREHSWSWYDGQRKSAGPKSGRGGTSTPSPAPSATPTPSETATPTPSENPTPAPSTTAPPAAPPAAAPPPPAAQPPAAPPPSAGGFPSAANTGVPAGVALTPYTGPSRITEPGTVIDSKLVTTPLVITAGAHNVTIRNSVIRANGYFLVLNGEGATNLQIIDSELDGNGNTSNDAAVGGENYTIVRANIHGTVDGLKIGDNVTVQDSYIHDLARSPGSHNDGIQSLGSNDVKILRNTIIAESGSTSAIILSTGSAQSMRRILIDGNLLGGGAYTVYGGYLKGTDDLAKVSDITISNNRFTTSVYPNGGAYGPLTSVDRPAVTLQGNVWHDGAKAGRAL